MCVVIGQADWAGMVEDVFFQMSDKRQRYGEREREREMGPVRSEKVTKVTVLLTSALPECISQLQCQFHIEYPIKY